MVFLGNQVSFLPARLRIDAPFPFLGVDRGIFWIVPGDRFMNICRDR